MKNLVDKIDESDPTEKRLKLVAESYKDEISKARDLHKGSLQHLKGAYDQYVGLLKRTETDLTVQVIGYIGV